mgnify:CR=1 FL=1
MQDNPAIRARARQKRYRLRRAIVLRERRREYYARNREKLKLVRLVKILGIRGITLQQYQELLGKQEYCCAICRSPYTIHKDSFFSSLHLDHDHRTGKMRGVLCGSCNRAIGLLPSPELLEVAASYLRSFREA